MFFGNKTKRNSGELTYTAERTPERGGTLRITLSGPITEHALTPLERLLATIRQHPDLEVAFVLSQVTFMNSIGIHQWMQFLRKIPASHPLALEECTPEIVEHLNLMEGFRGRAHVRSFQVAYYCLKCEKRTVTLFRTAEIPRGSTPAAPVCRCGGAMEADAPEEEYFHFLDSL